MHTPECSKCINTNVIIIMYKCFSYVLVYPVLGPKVKAETGRKQKGKSHKGQFNTPREDEKLDWTWNVQKTKPKKFSVV